MFSHGLMPNTIARLPALKRAALISSIPVREGKRQTARVAGGSTATSC